MSKDLQAHANELVATRRVKHSAIISFDNGAVWGTSTNPVFEIFKDSQEVRALFLNRPDDVPGEFTVAGEDYSLRQATGRSISGDKIEGGGGCCMVKTKYGHAIIVAVYDASQSWYRAMSAVENLALHLEEQGL